MRLDKPAMRIECARTVMRDALGLLDLLLWNLRPDNPDWIHPEWTDDMLAHSASLAEAFRVRVCAAALIMENGDRS